MDADDQYSQYAAEARSACLNQLSERRRGGRRGPRNGLSTDPQSVAARERRHRISDRFRILKSLVPGGNKLDTVSMLEEAINYVKFLKAQIMLHQTLLTACSTGASSRMESNPQAATISVDLCTGIRLNGTNEGFVDYNQQMIISPNQEFLNYSMAQSEHSLPPLPCSIQDEDDEDMLRP